MSVELIAIIVTFLIGITELSFVAWMTYRMSLKMAADDATLFLQVGGSKDLLKDMRESLRTAH